MPVQVGVGDALLRVSEFICNLNAALTDAAKESDMTSKKLFCLIAAAALIAPATTMARDTNYDFEALNEELAKEGLMI